MTVVYINSLKDTRMTAVVTALDAQTGNASIDILTAASVLLCNIPLSKPSFTEASQQITMAGAPKSGTAVASGTAALARIKDGAGTPNNIVTGLTVGTAGTDIVLNTTTIANGQTVTLTAGTITHG
jgi:hypothetical protein